MPDFDLQGRIQSVMQRVQDLRPNILPIFQWNAAQRGGPVRQAIAGQAGPGGLDGHRVWPGPKDFLARGGAGYRSDQGAQQVPTSGTGYRNTI